MITGAIARVDLTVGGGPVRSELGSRLASVRVAHRLSQPTQCELCFVTAGGPAAELDEFPIGSALEVRLVGGPGALFDGEVTCLELEHGPDGEAMLRIRAYDRLHRLRKRQQLRVFESVTVAELATALTADLGLAVVADDPGPVQDRVVQHRQNDLDLLAGLAHRSGRYLALDGTDLRLITLAGFGDSVPLALGKTLLEARVEANLDRLCDRVTAFGWHPQQAASLEESAAGARIGRLTGYEPRLSDVGVDGRRYLVDQPGRSPDDLTEAAQSMIDRAAGGALIISGVAEGDPRLRAGAVIEVDGLSAQLCGDYVLCETVHTVDATGYLTSFSSQPPPPPPDEVGSTLTLGLVTDVDDPDETGRVRISLPGHGNLDAGWFGVVCPAAGPDKGIVALPGVDDTVLVALPHGEPAAGVVLGGLYGTVRPPDSGVVDGAVRRWSLRTPEGLSIILDDAARQLRIADRTGSFVDLSPELVRVHAEAADLVIEAPGRTLTLRAKAVEFQQAVDVSDAHQPSGSGGGQL
ncbi:phage baseplate assembly protein V [Microlunatus speluncae]|uniref:phage baseplate assembly protein V n=1 Tax=Microlunatus speluncae TaxID=2594267 RepID=UPI001266403F|nr:phage baseplate assembly protein V [Microlunatus speluncae]